MQQEIVQQEIVQQKYLEQAMRTNNSILLGKYIYNILTKDADLVKYVGTKIFPLIIDEDVSFPFIVYSRTSITPNYVKDGVSMDEVEFVFHIVSNNYEDSLYIANRVRQLLEGKRFQDEEVDVVEMKVSSVSEAFDEDAYIQTLVMNAVNVL